MWPVCPTPPLGTPLALRHRLTGLPYPTSPTYPTDWRPPLATYTPTPGKGDGPGRLRFTANCKVSRYFSALKKKFECEFYAHAHFV